MNNPDRPEPRSKHLPRLLAVAVLLSAFITLAATSMWDKSPTFDEGFYISGGYGYLRTGDPTMAGRFHPVLAPVLSALPLLPLDLKDPSQTPGWNRELLIYAPMFLNNNNVDAQTIVRLSRLPMIAVGAALGFVVFAWSRRLFGNAGGFLSLFLFVLAPNILAHTRLATTDMVLTAAVFGATCLFHAHLRRPRVLLCIGAGLLAGAALLTKMSALLMFPGWLLLGLIYAVKPVREEEVAEKSPFTLARLYTRVGPRLVILVLSALLMATIATVTIGAAYRFQYERVAPKGGAIMEGSGNEHHFHAWTLRTFEKSRGFTPLPEKFLNTMHVFLDKARTGHPGYLFGEVGGPWWYYFPVTYLLKTPLGIASLALLAAVLLPWSARPRWALEVLVVPAIFLAGCMTSSINIGFRHVMPIMPFLLVFVGTLGTVRFRGVRVLHVLAAALVAWTAFSSLTIYPDYLAYFNELAGGPDGGARYLGDSNLDWGQDILALAKHVKANRIDEPVKVFLHRMTPIEKLGFEAIDGFTQRDPKPGWYALSATVEQEIYESPRRAERFRWLLEFEPVTIIGHTIRVYHITEAELESRRQGEGT